VYLESSIAQTAYPASDPYVLACGGTTVGAISGSSFEEYVWNDDKGATGGGISALFPVPSYQNAITLPQGIGSTTSGRGIPDVAGNASKKSGYPETLQGDSVGPVGGTSVVSPLYAGLVARINQLLGENVGFLNPTLYKYGSTICRDVTGAAGPVNNSYNQVTGYPAGVGWDACTGWGSIDGKALLSVCAPPPPPLTNSSCEAALDSLLLLIRERRVPVEYVTGALGELRECVAQRKLTEAQYAGAVAALNAMGKGGPDAPPSRES
jgi:kumamolisin